jgi:hypothetical protein
MGKITKRSLARRPESVPGLDLVPLLDPQTLDAEAAEAVRRLLEAGDSANTRRSYATALRYWAAWYRLRYGAPLALPVSVPVVLQFLADHAQRPDAERVPTSCPRLLMRL